MRRTVYFKHSLASWRIRRMRIKNPTGCEGKVATCWNHRMQAPKHGSYWKVPATSLQLSCLGPTHSTDHARRGARWWIKGCESFLHFNHQLRKFCSAQFFPFYRERPAARIQQVSGAGLGWEWEPLVCYSHVDGSGQMFVGAWYRNSKLPRWLSSPIQDPHCSPQQEEGPRKGGPKIVFSIADPNGLLRPLGHPSQQSTMQAISKISTHQSCYLGCTNYGGWRQLQPSLPTDCSHSFRTVALQNWHCSIERDQTCRRRLTKWDGQRLYFFLEGASSDFQAYSRSRVCHSHQTASDTTWISSSDLRTSDDSENPSRKTSICHLHQHVRSNITTRRWD